MNLTRLMVCSKPVVLTRLTEIEAKQKWDAMAGAAVYVSQIQRKRWEAQVWFALISTGVLILTTIAAVILIENGVWKI
jgi:hypothetical protein